MLKRLGIFILAALVITSCSSDEKETGKKRAYKDSVYAFMNSNKDVLAYGRIDIKSILAKSAYQKNEMINAFLAGEINNLKTEINFDSPVYFAVESEKDGRDARSFFFINLLDKDKLIKDMKAKKGFAIKNVAGIDYSYDGDVVIGMRNKLVLIAVEPGLKDAAKLIQEAFKYTDGKMADKKLIALIETPGDLTANFKFESMANHPNVKGQYSKDDLKGAKMQMRLNFEKGRMVLSVSSKFPPAMTNKINLTKSDKPIIAKKLQDEASGETLAAMQFSVDVPGFGMLLENNMFLDEAIVEVEKKLSVFGTKLKITDLRPEDKVRMPNTGNLLGSKWVELFIDVDAVAKSIQIPMGKEALAELDYITYEVNGGEAEFIIQTHRKNENFLATVLDVASSFAMLMMGQMSS